MTSLVVSNLSVDIDSKRIVENLNLTIKTGQWLCIIGPNGAGKSTALKALAGITSATGSLLVDDNDLLSMKVRDRACWISYVAQHPIMPAGMSVFDYVLLGRTAHLNLLATESKYDLDTTSAVLEDLELVQFRDRKLESLSGGERQRVAIARALTQQSPILLLDEPTTALDIGYQQNVLELINRLRKEMKIAVITTMHDLTVAGIYPDELLLMATGQIVSQGSALEVLTVESIAQYYGARVRIIIDDGKPLVLPEHMDRHSNPEVG